jgi:FemAB-related protein (PEP-CTERM system-associated)
MNISTSIQSIRSLNSPTLELALGFTGLDEWSDFIHSVYGYPTHRLVAFENDRPVGALILIEIHHPIFGHYLATAPYGSYGGFAFNASETRDKLLHDAGVLAGELGARYIVVRILEENSPPPKPWIPQPIYCTYRIQLPAASVELMNVYTSNHRNHIRKSQTKGNTVVFGHLELLDDAYEGLSRCMHELGSPYHNKKYLQTMAKFLGNALEFAVLYDEENKIIGSGVFITQGNIVSNLHANVLKEARTQYAGELLYWETIKHCIANNREIFDMGRSLMGSGNENFKLKWTNGKIPLAYWYWLAPHQELPAINQKNPGYQSAIAIWKKLPGMVVNTFGDYIIRGLA